MRCWTISSSAVSSASPAARTRRGDPSSTRPPASSWSPSGCVTSLTFPSPTASCSSPRRPPPNLPGRASSPRSWPVPPIRLSKILAQAGLSSRRGAETLLAEGRVTVNGTVRLEPGAQADPERDVIVVDGRRLEPAEVTTNLALHKPGGYVAARADPRGRGVVLDLLPPGRARVFPVGRLDADTEGLLLLTDDGPLTNYLL